MYSQSRLRCKWYCNRTNVELKKVNSKHIFKSTLTPQMQRKSVSVDSGIDRGATGASPTVMSGKLNRRDNVSIIHIPIRIISLINLKIYI